MNDKEFKIDENLLVFFLNKRNCKYDEIII